MTWWSNHHTRMMNRWIKTSERNLLKTHFVLVNKLKSFKKIFGKGQMMKTFEYIHNLYCKKEFKSIQRVQEMLIEKMPMFHQLQYHKYNELIIYCQFLLDSHAGLQNHVNTIITILDTNHELGRCIQVHILLILASQ